MELAPGLTRDAAHAPACGSLRRQADAHRPVASARAQAISHRMQPGATIFGLSPQRCFSPDWAAWANGVAVRELDFHDTFLAADD